MEKIGNFTKESLRNGALVTGGHRVKYVSEDKEFIILATRFGNYEGFYISYEKDGAYVDEDRTPAPSNRKTFNTLDECKKFFGVGLSDVDTKAIEMPTVKIDPNVKQWQEFKAKYPERIILTRIGDFYETYEDDAEICASILGITLTKRSKDGVRVSAFPYHAIDVYLPKLIRAGKRVAICDKLEDPKITKRGITEMVTPQSVSDKPKAENVKIETADAIVQELHIDTAVSSQIEMRKIVMESCKNKNIIVDHVCVWQHHGNGDYGLAVAFNGKKPVAVVNWERTRTNGKAVYSFVNASNQKYQELRQRI